MVLSYVQQNFVSDYILILKIQIGKFLKKLGCRARDLQEFLAVMTYPGIR